MAHPRPPLTAALGGFCRQAGTAVSGAPLRHPKGGLTAAKDATLAFAGETWQNNVAAIEDTDTDKERLVKGKHFKGLRTL